MSSLNAAAALEPLRVVLVDLSQGLDTLRPAAHDDRDVFAVFFWRNLPLGAAHLTSAQRRHDGSLQQLVAAAIAPAVADRLGEIPRLDGEHVDPQGELLRRLDAQDDEPRPTGPLPMSLIVCTRDRPAELTRCLTSLSKLAVDVQEIVVVDNGSAQDTVSAVTDRFPKVRYVAEPRPGLSRARNTGLAATSCPIVAFTDDDVTVTPDWAWRLWQAFSAPEVMAATGLVLPAELETPAQVAFEQRLGGFGRGYRELTYGPEFFRRHRARGVPAWRVGAGANMALRREAIDHVGEFDVRLGAGAAGCSEDSELWYRLLAEGWTCRYNPAAVVFHHHRSDPGQLRRQAHAYLRGHVAALFVQFARYRHAGNLRRVFASLPRYYLLRGPLELRRLAAPTSTFLAEFTGYVRGLRFLPSAFRTRPPEPTAGPRTSAPGRLSPRGRFLRRNPYPHPLTEGLFYREKMRAIHRIARDRPVARVLEVGGGQSALTSMLYEGALVVNIDLHGAYAQASPNRRDNLHFAAADATSLPFADATFDAVTMFDLLEHIPDDATAAAEALRVVRPGGFVLVTSPNERWRFPYYRPFRRLCPTDEDMMRRWGHVRRGYAVEELQELFGAPPSARSTFINPLTVITHDLGFSRLGRRPRMALVAIATPLAWLGYHVSGPAARGTETATRWDRPE